MQKEIIDKKFMESMKDKRPFLKRMFTVFISQEPKRIQEIKDALQSQDVEKLRHLAHSLKGGAATIGVDRVRECCLRLENASKAQDMEAAVEHLDSLEKEMRKAYAFMFDYLAEN
ncbi:Hpt domain-containing protein [uncultured Pseudodesulfovibrio sp.]|uniref:Hpt domain-containing protein n=1 Tax=uncultured Pseudodesulfovibrio sp. TaxID=2035858 RepID=UPI0029C8EFEA|nr:Hpt domain-containing protein [uncultured Pseudodesulfovibrio sp.]